MAEPNTNRVEAFRRCGLSSLPPQFLPPLRRKFSAVSRSGATTFLSGHFVPGGIIVRGMASTATPEDETSSTSSSGLEHAVPNLFGELGACLLTAKIPSVALRSGHGGSDIYIVRCLMGSYSTAGKTKCRLLKFCVAACQSPQVQFRAQSLN